MIIKTTTTKSFFFNKQTFWVRNGWSNAFGRKGSIKFTHTESGERMKGQDSFWQKENSHRIESTLIFLFLWLRIEKKTMWKLDNIRFVLTAASWEKKKKKRKEINPNNEKTNGCKTKIVKLKSHSSQ